MGSAPVVLTVTSERYQPPPPKVPAVTASGGREGLVELHSQRSRVGRQTSVVGAGTVEHLPRRLRRLLLVGGARRRVADASVPLVLTVTSLVYQPFDLSAGGDREVCRRAGLVELHSQRSRAGRQTSVVVQEPLNTCPPSRPPAAGRRCTSSGC